MKAIPQHSPRSAVLSSEPGLNAGGFASQPQVERNADRIEASPVPTVVAASAAGGLTHAVHPRGSRTSAFSPSCRTVTLYGPLPGKGMASESTTVRDRASVMKGSTSPDALTRLGRALKNQDGARQVGHHGEATSGYRRSARRRGEPAG